MKSAIPKWGGLQGKGGDSNGKPAPVGEEGGWMCAVENNDDGGNGEKLEVVVGVMMVEDGGDSNGTTGSGWGERRMGGCC